MLKRVYSMAVAALLVAGIAADGAHASDPVLHCTTEPDGSYTVSVSGPISVPCDDGGQCTELDFQVTPIASKKPSRAAVLVEHDVDVVEPSGSQVADACKGDRRTRLGLNDCSRRTVKINLDPGAGAKSFQIVAAGLRDIVESSIAVRGTGGIEGCRIVSLGSVAYHPNQQVTTAQQVTYKGCTVSIPTDPVTGEGLPGTISGANCLFIANAAPVSESEFRVNGISVGKLTFAEGAVSSGSVCTTKLVNRRLYAWCACEDSNGDGIPDGPIPACITQ